MSYNPAASPIAASFWMLFDTHCHLTDERFAADLDAVLERAWSAGLAGIVTVGSDADDSRRAADLARARHGLFATVGIHPHVAAGADDASLERVRELAARPEVVALGETGLDYHYDNSPRTVQRALFERHLDLAAATALPVVVHSRDADDDTAAMIRAVPGAVRGVLHCFTGGRGLLDAGLEAGWFVSFAGVVSFRTYGDADLVRAVPADRLLLETDAPYLAPVPVRGRRNEPAHVRHVATAVARLREVPEPDLARATTANARSFYRLES